MARCNCASLEKPIPSLPRIALISAALPEQSPEVAGFDLHPVVMDWEQENLAPYLGELASYSGWILDPEGLDEHSRLESELEALSDVLAIPFAVISEVNAEILDQLVASEVDAREEVGPAKKLLRFDIAITWTSRAKHASRVRLTVGGNDVPARLFLHPTVDGHGHVLLDEPLKLGDGEPIVIRRYKPMFILGIGHLVPGTEFKRARKARVAIADTGDENANALLEAIVNSPNGKETADLCHALGLTQQALGTTFERIRKSGSAVSLSGRWYGQKAFDLMVRPVLDVLYAYHRAHPDRIGEEIEPMMEAFPKELSEKQRRVALHVLEEQGKIVIEDGIATASNFTLRLNHRQKQSLVLIQEALLKAFPMPRNIHKLSREARIPIQAVDELVSLAVRTGELVLLDEGFIYDAAALPKLLTALEDLPKVFQVGEFRDLVGIGREPAVALLDYFDGLGWTKRDEDGRRITSRGREVLLQRSATSP